MYINISEVMSSGQKLILLIIRRLGIVKNLSKKKDVVIKRTLMIPQQAMLFKSSVPLWLHSAAQSSCQGIEKDEQMGISEPLSAQSGNSRA